MGEKKRRAAAAVAGKGSEGAALAHARRAQSLAAQSAFGPALGEMVTALETAPHLDDLWAQFSALVRFFNFRHPTDSRLRAVLARALDHPAVDPGDLVRPISSLALSRPESETLDEPLLLRLMQDSVLRDAHLEDIIATTRRAALLGKEMPLETMVAIAHQCFNTEYLLAQTAQEADAVERLKARLAEHGDLHGYATYAAYRPLHTLDRADALAHQLADTPLAELARRQVAEPSEERRLRGTIGTLGSESGAVSAAVRAQYEENPYPRWIRTQTSFSAAPLAQIARELFPAADVRAIDLPTRILVAGCGTGQNAIATARRFADCSVLAIDLSLASLAYAKRKTQELGISNIEYRQADLLAPGELSERFHFVESSGVLHHLEDPLRGWRVLTELVNPGGFMRIGLYSEAGRRHIAHARKFIAERGFDATADGIRRCRAAIRARGEDEMLAKVTRNEDFYSLSGCRDLLFHVQEHRFDLPQIGEMLGKLGLRFLGFEFPDNGITAARYRDEFPRDPSMTDLDGWHRFEQQHPDSFARMYQFWAWKPA
ncbi:MAG TPA: methyltransferase domain-containing protein [Burkholderiales bacterium]